MERPALKRLITDIEAGKVDVVVVIYKIDRLTCSLADFSKMVEVFERQGVSFVSVTQQFNTTTLAVEQFVALVTRLCIFAVQVSQIHGVTF